MGARGCPRHLGRRPQPSPARTARRLSPGADRGVPVLRALLGADSTAAQAPNPALSREHDYLGQVEIPRFTSVVRPSRQETSTRPCARRVKAVLAQTPRPSANNGALLPAPPGGARGTRLPLGEAEEAGVSQGLHRSAGTRAPPAPASAARCPGREGDVSATNVSRGSRAAGRRPCYYRAEIRNQKTRRSELFRAAPLRGGRWWAGVQRALRSSGPWGGGRGLVISYTGAKRARVFLPRGRTGTGGTSLGPWTLTRRATTGAAIRVPWTDGAWSGACSLVFAAFAVDPSGTREPSSTAESRAAPGGMVLLRLASDKPRCPSRCEVQERVPWHAETLFARDRFDRHAPVLYRTARRTGSPGARDGPGVVGRRAGKMAAASPLLVQFCRAGRSTGVSSFRGRDKAVGVLPLRAGIAADVMEAWLFCYRAPVDGPPGAASRKLQATLLGEGKTSTVRRTSGIAPAGPCQCLPRDYATGRTKQVEIYVRGPPADAAGPATEAQPIRLVTAGGGVTDFVASRPDGAYRPSVPRPDQNGRPRR